LLCLERKRRTWREPNIRLIQQRADRRLHRPSLENSPRVNDRLPSDTAVAATTSEMVSPKVAISSIAAVRRLVSVVPLFGGAKPGLPVSSAMVVVLANQFLRITCCRSHYRHRCRRPFGGIWATALRKKGDLMGFGKYLVNV
jgi:hypothetical protein